MASNPTAAPLFFDRALLGGRLARAHKQGPVSFLLDRAIEELADRLRAVLRTFADGADVGTPGDRLRDVVAGQVGAFAHVDVPDRESEGLALAPQALDLVVSALALQFVND